MAAKAESLRFDITANDRGSEAFSRFGRSVADVSAKMDGATARSIYLDDALKRQRETVRRSADAAYTLSNANELLKETEKRLADGALEAEFALKREAEAKKKDAAASLEAAAAAKKAQDANRKFADGLRAGGGPALLGPALLAAPLAISLGGAAIGAATGLAGAFTAGAGAVAAFGAVAKPVLSQALTAEQAVQKAQDAYATAIANGTKKAVAYKAEQIAIGKAYADMSPQQVALSKQLGDMAQGWQNLKAAQTPVVAGALQPWLKSVTDLTGKLSLIIRSVSPVVGQLGAQFDGVVNSRAFGAFRDFIAGTGTAAVNAAGGSLIDFLKAGIVLLPQFNPLINDAIRGIGDLGPTVLKWASSKKASEDITRFMGWFSTNGPAVGGMLRNIGGALKALAPGLGPASVTEMNLISGFFALIAKLPASVAKPLLDVAGALLLLNKLGVVKVGLKLLGPGAGAATAGEAAAGGATVGLWGKLLPGVRFAGGALIATVGVAMVLKNISTGPGKNAWDNPFGADPTSKDPAKQGLSTWAGLGHQIEHIFDDTRHAVAHIWDLTWNNTMARGARGLNDLDKLLGGWEHDVAHWFDVARADVNTAWVTTWNNTVGRAARGVADVVRWVGTLPGKIMSLFASAGSWLFGAGQSLVSGFVAGIDSWGGAIASALLNLIPSWARGFFGLGGGGGGLSGGGVGSAASKAAQLGFASGTGFAPAGWAWVGERGPELMRFRGGEQVLPAPASAAYAAARSGGMVNYYVTVNVPPTVNPREAGRQVSELILAHTKSGGRLYPQGVTPR